MPTKDKSEYVVQAVSNALDLLELFSADISELSITEICKQLNLRESTVLRLLMTLEPRGYVELDRLTGNYRMGLKTLELRQNFIREMDFPLRSKLALNTLVAACNETSYTTTFIDDEVVYLDVAESDAPVRVVSRMGSHFPLHSTASGKVNLAWMETEIFNNWLAKTELKKFTATTLADADSLHKELTQVREKGYAIDNEEMEMGVCCLAAPVRDYTKQIIGTISISGPTTRFTQERITQELAPLLLQSAEQLSTCLGCHTAEDR